MNEKGFTLVEVLGVIVILGAISLIAGNFFNKNVDKAEKTISDSQKTSILNAVEQWSVENTALLDDNETSGKQAAGAVSKILNEEIKKCVTTDYLYENGYLNTKDIKLDNNEKFSGYIIISWDEKNNQYKFRIAASDKEINSCKSHLVTSE